MSTREIVLTELRRAEGRPVSGQLIAERAGVSRVAVAKQVAALQEVGYVIEAVAREGYVLLSSPALAVPWEVAARTESPLWARITGGIATGSTNDDAKALAREGAAEGTVVVASRQASGRGRLGRSWESPAGGAYFSAVLRPAVPVARVSSLALAVALGVVRGLAALGVESQVKWPNDVLVAGKKVAGILLESAAEADRVDWVVVGVGLNVIAPAERLPVSYLSDIVEVTPADVVARALDGIAQTYSQWETGGFGVLQAEYASRDALVGQEVTVRGADGALQATGAARGIDGEGCLVVEGPLGDIVRVYGGEVTLRG